VPNLPMQEPDREHCGRDREDTRYQRFPLKSAIASKKKRVPINQRENLAPAWVVHVDAPMSIPPKLTSDSPLVEGDRLFRRVSAVSASYPVQSASVNISHRLWESCRQPGVHRERRPSRPLSPWRRKEVVL
jgi:hypothetical protein